MYHFVKSVKVLSCFLVRILLKLGDKSACFTLNTSSFVSQVFEIAVERKSSQLIGNCFSNPAIKLMNCEFQP